MSDDDDQKIDDEINQLVDRIMEGRSGDDPAELQRKLELLKSETNQQVEALKRRLESLNARLANLKADDDYEALVRTHRQNTGRAGRTAWEETQGTALPYCIYRGISGRWRKEAAPEREEREEVGSRRSAADLARRRWRNAERNDPVVVRDGEEVWSTSEFAGRRHRDKQRSNDDLLG